MNPARVFSRSKYRALCLTAVGLLWGPPVGNAQVIRDAAVYPLPDMSGPDADRLRVLQLEGKLDTEGYLLRSPSSLATPLERGPGLRWQLLAPELLAAHNSRIPLSMNDGSMWAGRGSTVRMMAGVRARKGPFTLVLAPQWTWVSNRSFAFPPAEEPARSPMQAAWRVGTQSADLPVRFGTIPYFQFDFGQSFIGLETQRVAFGLTSESQWWGPGIRNSLLVSNNAQGIPRLTLRSGEPLRTRMGDFSALWESGVLTESLHFDVYGANDLRSFNAGGITFRPSREPGLTLGVARTIVRPLVDWQNDILGNAADFFTSAPAGGRIDLRSLFARWVFPEDGFEVYGEWVGQSAPAKNDARADREGSIGYTLGLGWVRPLSNDSSWALHLSAEVTDLENRTPWQPGAGATYLYLDPGVSQGYTQRGQTIGAAIGPGSSSQWMGLDLILPRGQIGTGVERVRWDTDGFFSQLTGWSFIAHDVSVMPGIHAALRLGGNLVDLAVTRETRLNYLFQNWATTFTDTNRVDHTNFAARLLVRLGTTDR